jgi:hypothetical protein
MRHHAAGDEGSAFGNSGFRPRRLAGHLHQHCQVPGFASLPGDLQEAGPTADYDRDGKLDMFLANWWIESRSLLLKNETPGGNWLAVRVDGAGSVNRMGIGSRINVYPAGKLGQAGSRINSHEICIGYGYCSGQEAIAHIGLGKEAAVDLEVVLPHNRGKVTQENVKTNQYVTVK